MVTFGERIVGIMQVLHLRMLEMEAALTALDVAEEVPATEAFHAYRLARTAELRMAIAALEDKLLLLGDIISDPERAMQPADIINLDDYR